MVANRIDRIMLRRQFFGLLQAGLWGVPPEISIFRPELTDWTALMRLAEKQSLLGILFDGIGLLPQEMYPPQFLYTRWCVQVARIEESNAVLDRVLVRVFLLYQEHGLNPVLLKGQGVARSYKQPNHRQCGDIDIYLGKENYEEANRLLLEAGATKSGEESIKHASFEFQNVHIENHRIMAKLISPRANRYFQNEVKRCLPSDVRMVDINGHFISLPPVTFDVLFIFIHAFIHLLSSGVGLRQVCDWARLIATHKDTIDRVYFVSLLKTMNLTIAARAFGYVAVKYLGLPEDAFPLSVAGADKDGEALLDEIFATGNFGKYDKRVGCRPKGKWAGRWYTFRRVVLRCYHLRALARVNAFWYPLRLIQGRIKMLLKQV